MAVVQLERPQPQEAADVVVRMKLGLMDGINQKLTELYKSRHAAENALDISAAALSRLHTGEYWRFSIPWLLILAERIGMQISIKID